MFKVLAGFGQYTALYCTVQLQKSTKMENDRYFHENGKCHECRLDSRGMSPPGRASEEYPRDTISEQVRFAENPVTLF